ncbi:MAG TPA: hypothetical protein VH540_15240 [Ktedonobacterales bacterium]|jgi:hypothetical protein
MPPDHTILTLQDSLEALMLLSEGALISSAGDEWSAKELLDWFQTTHPTLLEMPVYLVPPEPTRAGAICQVDANGEVLSAVPLYRIERRQPTGYPL